MFLKFILPLFFLGHCVSAAIFGVRKPETKHIPYTAPLSNYTSGSIEFKCGGTLIDLQFILTSAHCVDHINL